MADESASVSHLENEENSDENSSVAAKQQLKDAVCHFEHLLSKENLIAEKSSPQISEEAMKIGEEIYNNTMEMMQDKSIITTEELIMENELDEEGLFEYIEESDSSDEFQPEEKKPKVEDHIPLEYKIKVVNLAKKTRVGRCIRFKKKDVHG